MSETVQLLRRWRDGDQQALAMLLQRHMPWIERQIQRRMGHLLRQHDDTQAFVQEAMVHVLEYGPRFEVSDPDQYRGLMARIIENTLRQKARYLRRERRDPEREVELSPAPVLHLDAGAREVTRPSTAAQRNEHVAWVRLAVDLLDPEDHEVIVQHHFEGLTFGEVGERLGLTAEAVRTRFRRALPRLARKVQALRAGSVTAALDEPGDEPPQAV